MISTILWDWNGTLLDDVDACVATLNSLLAERGLPVLPRAEYEARFGFPVRAFYEGLGFDFAREDFAALSVCFIERYRAQLARARLQDEAVRVMAQLRGRVEAQRVVSAMEHNLLGLMLRNYGLLSLLDSFHGTGDLQAGSKIEIGRQALAEHGIDAREVLIVGDTVHDHELAEALGCACVLFSRGHQHKARLLRTGRPIIDSLAQVRAYLGRSSR